jgi:hypothetical protein
MARIRSIKPEMPADEKLALCARDARLTFVYLITQADDEGLLLAKPRQLMGALFPHDEDVTDDALQSWVDALVAVGVVRKRRTRDGSPVLQLVNWRHQKIDRKTPSKILPLLEPLAEGLDNSSRGSREALANSPRAAREGLDNSPPIEVERDVDRGSLTLSEENCVTQNSCELSTPPRVENPHEPNDEPPAPPAVAGGTTPPRPPRPTSALQHPSQALKSPSIARFVAKFYPELGDRRREVVRQLDGVLSDVGTLFEGSRVYAVDVEHLDATCAAVLHDDVRKPDAAIVIVLKKLRDSRLEVKSARDKALERVIGPKPTNAAGPVRIAAVLTPAVG